MHSIINDLERVADIYYQMSKTFEQMQSEGTDFKEPVLIRLKEMLNLILEDIQLVRNNLKKDYGTVDLDDAIEVEGYIDAYRDELLEFHYSQLENKAYSNKAGFIFLDYVNRMEKIGDHLFNVNEAMAGIKVKAAYEKVIEERG